VRGDSILMVEHREADRTYWTLPGGGIELDETPEAAVLRELREETGLEGTVARALFDDVHPRRPGIVRCFAVEVDSSAVARLGTDPELAQHEQMLVAVAWRPLASLHDDPQVRRVLGVLSRAAE
jgi:ADP-ribose pyrophosphatase YjhB (NUDIX family)